MRHVLCVFVEFFSRLQRHILRSAHKKKIEVRHATCFLRFCCNFLSFTTTHSALLIFFQYTYRGATCFLRFISDFLLISFCFLQVPEGSRRFILIPAHWGGVCALFIWTLLCCSFLFDSLRVWVPPTFVPSEHFSVHGQNIFGKKKPSQLSIFKLGLDSIFIFIPSEFLLASEDFPEEF